jgi:hypothetical protein
VQGVVRADSEKINEWARNVFLESSQPQTKLLQDHENNKCKTGKRAVRYRIKV